MISCAQHDYIEIACIYGFEVRLAFKDGKVVQGKAFQTAYNENREECIVLKTVKGAEKIVLEHLASIEAVTQNPHFDKIDLG